MNNCEKALYVIDIERKFLKTILSELRLKISEA